MDLIRTIERLRREKERLERVIASLEPVHATVAVPVRGRRGREKSVSVEERRQVSARIKQSIGRTGAFNVATGPDNVVCG